MGRPLFSRMERAARLCGGRVPPLRDFSLHKSRRPELPELLLIQVAPALAFFKVAEATAARAPLGYVAACPLEGQAAAILYGFTDADDSSWCLPLPPPRSALGPRSLVPACSWTLTEVMELNARMVFLWRELSALALLLMTFQRLAEHRALTLTNLLLDVVPLALEVLRDCRLRPDEADEFSRGELRRKLGSLRAVLAEKLTRMTNVNSELGGLCLADALAAEMEILEAHRGHAGCARPQALTWQVHNGTERVAQATSCLLSAIESEDMEFLRSALNDAE